MRGWAPQREVLGFWLDTEVLSISLPQRKVDGITERLAAWSPDQRAVKI